jgi:hypothetical protein
VIAVASTQLIRLDSYIQIIIAVFENGEYQGYVLPTRTTQISRSPKPFIDQDGNLHLIWQDGSDGKYVFYASTSPKIKAQLDRLSFSDLPTLFLSGGLEAITGILLFPFAFPWMAVGFILLVIWRLVRNDENVTFLSSKILLGIALISFQVSKLLFLPDILIYVPFSAWIDVPSEIGSIMKIAVPMVIFGIGLLVAEFRRRKATSPPSALGYFLYVVITDTILTLSVYGVIFLGEY